MSNFCFDISLSDSFVLLGSRWRGGRQKTTATQTTMAAAGNGRQWAAAAGINKGGGDGSGEVY
jgi:hypothetical protein